MSSNIDLGLNIEKKNIKIHVTNLILAAKLGNMINHTFENPANGHVSATVRSPE